MHGSAKCRTRYSSVKAGEQGIGSPLWLRHDASYSDLSLPDLRGDGVDAALSKLSARSSSFPGVPIPAAGQDLLKSDGYVAKPFESANLLARLVRSFGDRAVSCIDRYHHLSAC
jgi:hypothetical protein